jgi:large subunit ribosomal protein L18
MTKRKTDKTDKTARFNLLKSKFPRLVIRKTNLHIITQIVTSKEAQDTVICSANSKELINLGWTGSLKNVPSSYLTGMLLAKKAKEKGIKKSILDIGRYTSTKGSKIYAVVKGAIEGGIEINCDEKMLPKEERISGKNTKNPEKTDKEINKIKSQLK